MTILDRYEEYVFLKGMKLLSFWRRLRGQPPPESSLGLSRQQYEEVILATYRDVRRGKGPMTKEEVEQRLRELKNRRP